MNRLQQLLSKASFASAVDKAEAMRLAAPVSSDDALDRACEAFDDVYDGVSHNKREAVQAAVEAALREQQPAGDGGRHVEVLRELRADKGFEVRVTAEDAAALDAAIAALTAAGRGGEGAKVPTGPYVERIVRIFRDKPHDDTSALVLIDYANARLAATPQQPLPVGVTDAMRKRAREWLARNNGYWDDDYVNRLLEAIHQQAAPSLVSDPRQWCVHDADMKCGLCDYAKAAPAASGEGIEYQFEVWQDEMPVASGSASTPEEAQREAGHYALMYGQDGPVEVRFYERRPFQQQDTPEQEADDARPTSA